jgi:hypothetical protein
VKDHVKLRVILTTAFLQGTDPDLLDGSEITTGVKPESQYLFFSRIRSSPLLQKKNEILETCQQTWKMIIDDNLVS